MPEVPYRVNPTTSVAKPDRPRYASGESGLDLRGVAEAARGFGAMLETDRKEKQNFDLSKTLIEEANWLQNDFTRRTQEADQGAPNFIENTMQEYTDRHIKLVDDWKKQGYSEDVTREMELRLASMDSTYLGNATKYKLGSELDLAQSQVEDFAVSSSQYAEANPEALDSALEELHGGIFALPIDETNKQKLYDQYERGIIQSAGRGLAQDHPELVIGLLDPGAQTVPGTESVRYSGFQKVAADIGEALGLDPADVATVFSYETAGTFDPNIYGGKGGNYFGLIQFGKEERAKYGIEEGASPEQWTQAILGFMKDRGFKKGMGLLDFYSTINAGSPGRYNASDGPGNTVRGHVKQMKEAHFAEADKWLKAGMQTLSAPAVQGPTPFISDENKAKGLTGNVVLDKMDAQERAQVLGLAKSANQDNQANQKAELDLRHENAVNAYIATGQFAGDQPSLDEYNKVYGPVIGPQKFAELENSRAVGSTIQHFNSLSDAAIQAQVESLRPKDTASPTYATDLKAYEMAQQAATTLLAKRAKDPALDILSSFPKVAQKISGAEDVGEMTSAIAAMDTAYAKRGVPKNERFPFTNDQATELAENYKAMGGKQKAEQLLTWDRTMGPLKDAFLRQMGKKGIHDFVLLDSLKNNPNKTNLLYSIMSGRDQIQRNAALKPSPQLVNKQFTATVGKALNRLNPELAQAYNDNAVALYVQNGGQVDAVTGVLDTNLYQDALRQVVGGIAGRKDTGIVNFSKGSATSWTILPPGVSEAQFENWKDGLVRGELSNLAVGRAAPRNAYGKGLPLSYILDNGVFVLRAPNVYAIQMSNDGNFLTTDTGQPFLVRITPEVVRGK